MDDIERGQIAVAIIRDFIRKQRIWSAECVYQSDRVIENAYEFISELCDLVGYIKLEDEDDE